MPKQSKHLIVGLVCLPISHNEPLMNRDTVRWNKFSVSSDGFHHPVDEHVRRHLGHPYHLATDATADVLGLFAAQDFVDP